MTIDLYVTSSDPRVMSKSLTLKQEAASCVWTEPSSVTDPVLLIKESDAALSSNYVYIPKLSRYYYIKNIEVLNGAQLRLSCHVDVLMSFKTEILANTVTVKRNSNYFDLYLDDPYFHSQNKNQIQTKIIPGTSLGLSKASTGTYCYVLTVAGGDIE